LRRRPRPKLGCGAKERRRRRSWKIPTWKIVKDNIKMDLCGIKRAVITLSV
jgi:hypothetical protein